MQQVAVKMGCDAKAVKLHKMTKTLAMPPGILRENLSLMVSETELASKYKSSELIATIF